jgi:hypothetical protein
MASTKSTVVGIRLDHERRAWVEAEAERLGVSVRGLFEGMIDEARLGESAEADRAIAGLASVPGALPGQGPDEIAAAVSSGESREPERSDGVHAGSSLPGAAKSSLRSGATSVTSVPGGLLREAFSLTASLIELSGRCAADRLSSCVLTRRFSKRPL